MYSIAGFNATHAYYNSLVNESQKKILAGYRKQHYQTETNKSTTVAVRNNADKQKSPYNIKNEPKSRAPHRIDDSVFNPTNGFLTPGVTAKLNLSNTVGIDPKGKSNKTKTVPETNNLSKYFTSSSRPKEVNDIVSSQAADNNGRR